MLLLRRQYYGNSDSRSCLETEVAVPKFQPDKYDALDFLEEFNWVSSYYPLNDFEKSLWFKEAVQSTWLGRWLENKFVTYGREIRWGFIEYLLEKECKLEKRWVRLKLEQLTYSETWNSSDIKSYIERKLWYINKNMELQEKMTIINRGLGVGRGRKVHSELG